MKKLFVLLAVCSVLLTLGGCAERGDTGGEVMQALADRSAAAKAFADPLFAEHMVAGGMRDHTVEQSACGFYTADLDDSVYVVGYRYHADGDRGMYGYRGMIDDHGICRLLEEGVDVARLIWPEQ